MLVPAPFRQDSFVAVSHRNAATLPKVFNDFGYQRDDLPEPDFIIGIRLDPGITQCRAGSMAFDECCGRRVELQLGALKMKFIGKDGMIRNRKASGRPKDPIDSERLGATG